jgi:hypothetical protein
MGYNHLVDLSIELWGRTDLQGTRFYVNIEGYRR